MNRRHPEAHFDPLDESHLADPYPAYEVLRRDSPVAWHEGMQCWVLSRYQDVVRASRDWRTYARDWRRSGASVPSETLSIQNLDPPEQRDVQGVAVRALRSRKNQPNLSAIAEQLVLKQESRSEGPWDFMETLARPYALAAVCALLGVEAPDSDKFRPVSDAVLYAMDAGLRPERVQTGISARAELASMVESWSTERSDGLLGDLLSARALDPALVRNTARVFFQGGYSTLFAGLGNVANLIFGDPALQEMCATADEPERQAIMQEGLRLDGPVQASARVLLDDRSIRGVDLRAGETVLSLFAAANHDSEVFSEPDLFLLNRAARSVAFGHGTHACTAASFAVVAMSSLFAALLRDGRRYKLEGPRQRRDTATLRSFACLGYGPAGLG